MGRMSPSRAGEALREWDQNPGAVTRILVDLEAEGDGIEN